MQVDLSVKNVLIAVGLISAACGNVFYIGKLYSDFELFKTELSEVQANQNVLTIKQELLELNYKIKSLRFEIDGTHEDN
jgi:hypothetical protein|tara:strand:+ start:646 stop:882 length:237 start_codon:yes stop_codon:yes gene_type:complete